MDSHNYNKVIINILQELVLKNCCLGYHDDKYYPKTETAYDCLYRHLSYYTVSI